jgi:transcriptional regulator with XRE-family HTH domain
MTKRLQELLHRLTPAERAGQTLEVEVPLGVRLPRRTPNQMLLEVQDTLTTKSIGEALTQARKQAGLKAKDMAQSLDVSPPRIAQIESEGANLTLATVLEHAHASDCEVELVLRPRNPKLPSVTAVLTAFDKPKGRTMRSNGQGRSKKNLSLQK